MISSGPLIISRKSTKSYGGLARFAQELAKNIPRSTLLTPDDIKFGLDINIAKQATVIHLCDATLLPLGVLLKKLYKKPLSVTAHGLDLNFPNVIYQKVLHSLMPYADAIILDSQKAKPLLKNFESKALYSVINPGVTIEHLKTSEKIALRNLSSKKILTSVGNLVQRKGHAFFLEKVLPLLPKDFVYLLIGEGPQRKTLLEIAKKNHLEDRFFLLGRVNNAKLRYVLDQTFIYISPNIPVKNNFESFGIAAAEAAALGIPVVSSNVDGISEAIIDKVNGVLVKPTPKSFVKAIMDLSKEKNRIVLKKSAGNFTAKNFDWKKTGQKYSSIFRQVLNKS